MENSKLNKKIKRWEKDVKFTGWMTLVIGWANIIFAPIYLLSTNLDSNYSISYLSKPDFTDTLIACAGGFTYIVLGNRIKNLNDKNIKKYLQITLAITILFAISARIGGEPILGQFVLSIFLISSLFSINNLMKIEEFTVILTHQKYKLGKKGWIIFSVVSIILFVTSTAIDYNISNPNAFLIQETVRQIKKSMVLPKQLDRVTKLVDITAEPNAIRYHSVLSGIDKGKLTNAYLTSLKNYISMNVCQNKDTRYILNHGVNMEYSYTVEGSHEKYFLSFSQKDCQK